MDFIRQGKKGIAGAGFVPLTICFTLVSFIAVQFLTEVYCVSQWDFSLTNIPDSANKNAVLALLLLPFAAALMALLASVRFIHKQPLLTLLTSRAKFDWKRFFVAFSMWGAILGIIALISYLSGEEFLWNFDGATFPILLFVSITLAPIQTASEDILFRGYLFQQIGRSIKNPWVAIIGTGVLFGILHGANPEVELIGYSVILYYIISGIFLGLVTHLDNGLELSLGYHAINNIFALVVLTNEWQVFQTGALLKSISPPPSSTEVLLSIIIAQPLLLFLFSKIYGWKKDRIQE